MEQTKSEEEPKEAKTKKPIPKLKGRPCNELLLCRKYDVEEKLGSLYLTTEDGGNDLRDNVQKKAEIIQVSPKLIVYMDDFEIGDIVTYPKGTKEMFMWLNDEPYFLIHKKDASYVESGK